MRVRVEGGRPGVVAVSVMVPDDAVARRMAMAVPAKRFRVGEAKGVWSMLLPESVATSSAGPVRVKVTGVELSGIGFATLSVSVAVT